jgi:hypothetical protein
MHCIIEQDRKNLLRDAQIGQDGPATVWHELEIDLTPGEPVRKYRRDVGNTVLEL